jgi:hypothetical protein
VEPISPELALIDPELRRAHLAWLEQAAEVRPAPEPEPVREPSPAIEPQADRWAQVGRPWRTGAVRVAVALSLGANGFLAAVVVARDRPSLAAQKPAAAVGVLVPPAVPDAPAAATTSAATSAQIEQRILSLVAQSPRARLPASFVDAATGLPKNGLQAVCRGGPADSQLCIVRPTRHRPGEGVVVRYTPSQDGRGTFTWSPYRSG